MNKELPQEKFAGTLLGGAARICPIGLELVDDGKTGRAMRILIMNIIYYFIKNLFFLMKFSVSSSKKFKILINKFDGKIK